MSDQSNSHEGSANDSPTSLTSGRDWSALPLRHEQYEWSMEAEGPLVQGPLDMEFLRGQRMLLTLEEGQYGLLVHDGALKALYLDGCHHLDIGNRPDQVQTDSHLFFLSTSQPVEFRWTSTSEHGFTTSDGTQVIGRCSVRIEKPARFYHRILRNLSDWSPETVNSQLEPLVHQAFNNLLSQVCQLEWDHPGGLQSALMGLGASQLDEFLSEHGLFCESLAAYTAAPPVENWQNQTTGQSTDLLHS